MSPRCPLLRGCQNNKPQPFWCPTSPTNDRAMSADTVSNTLRARFPPATTARPDHARAGPDPSRTRHTLADPVAQCPCLPHPGDARPSPPERRPARPADRPPRPSVPLLPPRLAYISAPRAPLNHRTTSPPLPCLPKLATEELGELKLASSGRP